MRIPKVKPGIIGAATATAVTLIGLFFRRRPKKRKLVDPLA